MDPRQMALDDSEIPPNNTRVVEAGPTSPEAQIEWTELQAVDKMRRDEIWAKISAIKPPQAGKPAEVDAELIVQMTKVARHLNAEQSSVTVTEPLPFDVDRPNGLQKDGNCHFDDLINESLELAQGKNENGGNIEWTKIANQWSLILNYLPLTWEEYKTARQIFEHVDTNNDGTLQVQELEVLKDENFKFFKDHGVKLFPEALVGATQIKQDLTLQNFLDYIYISKTLQAAKWGECKPLHEIKDQANLTPVSTDQEEQWQADAVSYKARFECATGALSSHMAPSDGFVRKNKTILELEQIQEAMEAAVAVKDYVTAGALQTKLNDKKGLWRGTTGVGREKTAHRDATSRKSSNAELVNPARKSCECAGCVIA